MKPTGARIRIRGHMLLRQVEVDGQVLSHVDSIRIDEGRDNLQRVTITFLTNQATVEPATPPDMVTSIDTPDGGHVQFAQPMPWHLAEQFATDFHRAIQAGGPMESQG